MPLRDLLVTAIVFGSIPYMWKRPFWGLLMWVWLSIMNPHRQTFGFAYDMPFAQIVAIVTLLSVFVHGKALHRFPLNGATVTLLFFIVWIGVSPLASFHSDGEYALWLRAVKILLMVLVAFFVVGTRKELHLLVWVMTMSIGFYGIKGGVFTIATGGGFKVWGPSGSFIEDNNACALALTMAVPLFRYLQLHSAQRLIKLGCIAAMVLCSISAIGSYSRGALVALAAMGCFFWFKSRNKFIIGAVLVVALPAMFAFMPDAWSSRMSTIGDYSQDGSAMGRINAWYMAFNLAASRFPIGGGFNIYTPELFARFAPVAEDIHAAHSIYFQVLGEHGFMGLFIFLTIYGLAWRSGSWVIRQSRKRDDLRWAADMAQMSQVSLIAYLVGGAFLSLTYYDFPYYVVVVLVALREVVRGEVTKPSRGPAAASPYIAATALPGATATHPTLNATQVRQ